MRNPSRAVLLASIGLAMVACAAACGIDALGTMPAGEASSGSPAPGPSTPPRADATVAPEDDAAVAMDAGDDAAATIDATVDAPPDGPLTPLLELTHAVAPATANLTTEGTLDWAYWGADGNTTSLRKAGVPTISALTIVYVTTGGTASGFGTTFSWTNSTAGSGSSDGYVYVTGNAGASEAITVPTGPAKRTLTVWVGGNEIRGKLTATLADGSVAAKSDTTYGNQNGTFAAKYTIDFRTLAPSTLEVKWAIDETFGTNSARFTAVALR